MFLGRERFAKGHLNAFLLGEFFRKSSQIATPERWTHSEEWAGSAGSTICSRAEETRHPKE